MKKAILRTVLLVLAVSFLSMSAAAKEEKEMETQREILDFNTGWLFSASDYANAQLELFDDRGFESVCIPHANTRLTAHKGSGFQNQIESYRFVSWYRRHFSLPSEYEGKRITVSFDGVATVAEVYVNGRAVGSHKGAYTGFSFDITELVRFGGADNVIAVRVDSTKRSDIPPEGGSVDYCLFGGIVRKVQLRVTNPLYVDDVFLTTPDLTAKSGIVRNEVSLKNLSGEDKSCKAETVLLTAEGEEAARASSDEITVPDGESAALVLETSEIKNPRLWDIDDPYLYTAKTRIYENGALCDEFSTRIGLRFFEFKSGETDASFYLNGKKTELRGINRHEQWPWQGRAIPGKLQAADADLIKETGFNAVRCSHYPQAPEFLDRCDEIGLIVLEEAPGWQHIGSGAWQEIYKENLREMILRDRNHPSIVTWGVRVNESWDNHELYTSTAALSKLLDPTRPTHGVRRNENYESTEMIEDIFGSNYQYPEKPRYTPFVSTEHSWECWTNGCGFPWAGDGDAMRFTKSFADVVDYYYRNDLCAGGFAWSMFDYNNEVNYTNTGHVFYSGIYDIFRLDKPAAHFYRSQKNPEDEIELYIASYWTETSPSTVEVYSNCDEVELFVNGVSKGKIKPNLYMNVPHPVFSFENIAFEKGELTAVGYIGGAEAARAVRRTPEAAARLALKADYDTLAADGSDTTSVTVELLDKNGTRLPYADNTVTINVEGAAEFIGEEAIALEGGRTAFLLRSKYNETGTVHCTVSADGIEAAELELEVKEFDGGNTVPCSEGTAEIEPLRVTELNDTDEAFAYSGGWDYCEQRGAYSADNHYTDAADASVSIRFTGDAARVYGAKAPGHGIMAVSVDGGKESFVDCYSKERQDNALLYSTLSLGGGEHVITIRCTGERNSAATGGYITADRISVLGSGSVIVRRIAKNAFDGGYSQTNSSFGDVIAFAEGTENCRIRARVTLPEGEDTGVSLAARAADESHFYQLEIKYENGGRAWGIWKNDADSWSRLASGKYAAEGESAYIAFELCGDMLSAYTSSDGKEWTPLGSCRDQSFSEGKIALRTHNTSASFSDFAAFEVSERSNSDYELRDAAVLDGKVTRVRISKPEGAAAVAAAVSYDGEKLERVCSAELSDDGTAEIEAEGTARLLLWESLSSARPLCGGWEL